MKLKIGIVGLGYDGLPLAIELAKKYNVIGYDKFNGRIKNLKKNLDTNNEISQKEIKKSSIRFTSIPKDLANVNFFIITVPTPINKKKLPDISLLKLASKQVGKLLKKMI